MRFIILLFFLSVYCCRSSEISVNETRKYSKTDYAKRSDVNEFFNRRMKNKPRKALVGNWEILFEDEENLYYGYPRFKGIFNDERVVDKIYFLNIKELKQQFPAYDKITGIEMRIKIYTGIAEFQKKKNEKLQFTLTANDWSAELKENTIEVSAITRSLKIDSKEQIMQKYELVFDKKDLNILKQRQK